MEQPKFTISLLGFDERSTEFLSRETRKTMRIVDPISKNDTQVVVVDTDNPDGIAIWDEFRKQWPHMPAVVIASDEPDIDDASFAEKPFTVEALIDSITEAIILSPSAEKISNEAMPEDEALELQPAMEISTDATTKPEAEESEPFEESSDQLADLPLEKITVDAADSPPAEEVLSDAIEAAPEIKSSIDVAVETEDVGEEAAQEEKHGAIDTSEDGAESKSVPDTEKEMPPLSEIASGLATNTSTSNVISNRTLDNSNLDDRYFDPDAHMIGLVLKGISSGEKTGAIAKLSCLLDRTIYIDARNKLVSSNLKDIHMRQIAIAPLGKGDSGLDTELEMIKSTTLEELSGSESSLYPLETFVWELAILTSNGRAPIGTPMEKPTYLMQWPNFTRLMHIPDDMKVAAYWLRLPSSLFDLSDNLNISMHNILLLYSAASLTGLAGVAKRKSDKIIKPGKPEEHKNRSLFSTIIGRLSKR